MPPKKDPYQSYGQKLISLFARLLFSGDRFSLTELSKLLTCSKQTISRLLDDITMAFGVEVEESWQGNRKYLRLRKVGKEKITVLPLTQMELDVLYLCRAFAEHLLGKNQFEEAAQALLKTGTLLPENQKSSLKHFAAFQPGRIDYTPHQETMRTILHGMEESKICKVQYQVLGEAHPKIFYIKPLKIFSYRDTVYLHARKARHPGKPYREPEFDPLLALHRINKVELTDRLFEFPKDYDFEKAFNRGFGIIKGKNFAVEVEFSGWAAHYVAERIWSQDQKIEKKANGKIKLSFTASSESEVLSWLLFFGEDAQLLSPAWLVTRVRKKIEKLSQLYSLKSSTKEKVNPAPVPVPNTRQAKSSPEE
jgi:predicted DNA-binding transcriptional regulator YafY